MLTQEELEKSWHNFLYERPEDSFPRQYSAKRLVFNKESEYLGLLHTFWNKGVNFWIGIYPIGWIIQRKFGKIYVDVDADYLDKAKEKALKVQTFLDEWDLKYTICFSGNKGFNFYIYLSHNPEPISNFGFAVRKFFDPVKDEIDLTTLGDVARISRVVNTKHPKSKLFCVQIDDIKSFRIEQALEPKPFIPSESNEWFIGFLKLMTGDENKKFESLEVRDFNSVPLLPPCVLGLIDKLFTQKHLTHFERFELVTYLMSVGYEEDYIKSLFQEASDFDVRETENQIEQIKRIGYLAYGYDKMCQFKMCPIKRRSDCLFRCGGD